MYLIFLRKKALSPLKKGAHHTILVCLQLDRSAPHEEVQATSTLHGHSNINLNAICSMQNQPMHELLKKKRICQKNIYRTACSTINLWLCWRVRPLLIAEFTPALRQGFPSQSRFMFRPKKPQRLLWKRGLATKAFGLLCPADSVGTQSSTPT
jgi:hypothetical protein